MSGNALAQDRHQVELDNFAACLMRNVWAGGNGGDLTAEYITGKVQVADGFFPPELLMKPSLACQ